MDLDEDGSQNVPQMGSTVIMVPKELHYCRPTYAPYSPYAPCPPYPPNRPFPHECNWSYTGRGDRVPVFVVPMAIPPEQRKDKGKEDVINNDKSKENLEKQSKNNVNGDEGKEDVIRNVKSKEKPKKQNNVNGVASKN